MVRQKVRHHGLVPREQVLERQERVCARRSMDSRRSRAGQGRAGKAGARYELRAAGQRPSCPCQAGLGTACRSRTAPQLCSAPYRPCAGQQTLRRRALDEQAPASPLSNHPAAASSLQLAEACRPLRVRAHPPTHPRRSQSWTAPACRRAPGRSRSPAPAWQQGAREAVGYRQGERQGMKRGGQCASA